MTIESIIFKDIEAKKPKRDLPGGFQYQNMRTYFIDTDTKESRLGVKNVLVQNDRVSEYLAEFRILDDNEVSLAGKGFLDIQGVRDEALKRLAHPNERDLEAGYKPLLRPKRSDVIAKCNTIRAERLQVAYRKEAQESQSFQTVPHGKKK